MRRSTRGLPVGWAGVFLRCSHLEELIQALQSQRGQGALGVRPATRPSQQGGTQSAHQVKTAQGTVPAHSWCPWCRSGLAQGRKKHPLPLGGSGVAGRAPSTLVPRALTGAQPGSAWRPRCSSWPAGAHTPAAPAPAPPGAAPAPLAPQAHAGCSQGAAVACGQQGRASREGIGKRHQERASGKGIKGG